MDSEKYVIARYYLETPMDLGKAAQALATEQSSGSWTRVGYETDRLIREHGAIVLEVKKTGTTGEKSLPSAMDMRNFMPDEKASEVYNCGEIRIAFPHINFGAKLPTLLSCVAGNLYEMGAFTAIKLLELQFPESFLNEFKGPKFGIEGTRKILKVRNRPIIGAIIKPCVGLSPKEIAELAYEGAKGGIDFMKDDELFADTAYNRVEQRVVTIMEALDRAESETGEKKMYAFNITDEIGNIMKLHDTVVDNGGNCVMLNFVTAGFSALRMLAEQTKVPIHAHRDFFPPLTRCPHIGMSATVFTRLARLAGADQLHCGAIQGKLYESDEEFLANSSECTNRLGSLKKTLPVSSGGQWAGKAPVNYRKIKSVDFLHLSGAGTFAHPDGAEAGAKSIRQAWDATLQDIKLEDYAKTHKELARAIEKFGRVLY